MLGRKSRCHGRNRARKPPGFHFDLVCIAAAVAIQCTESAARDLRSGFRPRIQYGDVHSDDVTEVWARIAIRTQIDI